MKKTYKVSALIYYTQEECERMRIEMARACGVAGRICGLLNCEVESPTLERRLRAILELVESSQPFKEA